MEKTGTKKHRYGLVGKNIAYSFSRAYFSRKFEALGLEDHIYENFDLEDITALPDLLEHTHGLKGLNVTIPYKEAIIPFLDQLDPEAREIGAVNTIKISENKRLKGYNTDVYGFRKAIEPLLKPNHKRALVLGTGGASKAVAFVLDQLEISYRFVSRKAKKEQFTYGDLNKEVLEEYSVVINCTPLGTFPDVDKKPELPYQFVTDFHLFFDLIYNPEKTAFLAEAERKGALICNGLKMLELQAEKAWEIWNS